MAIKRDIVQTLITLTRPYGAYDPLGIRSLTAVSQHAVYGRLDEDVAAGLPVLEKFLATRSPSFTCRLVQKHHAKVIWWKGFGVYIGSANLTHSAWYTNVEAGCFFHEEDITDLMASEISQMFEILHENSTPLTDELLKVMRIRAHNLGKTRANSDPFCSEASIKTWSGLAQTSPKSAMDQRRARFLA